MSSAEHIARTGPNDAVRYAPLAWTVPFPRHGWLMDCGALGLILLVILFYFRNGILDGQVYFEPDTTSFYYPVMSLVHGALNQFSIPLWTPYIYGGFPLFADGEAGMLYPPNLLLMWLLPMPQVFLWGRVLRFFMAGAFMYAYLRSLSVSRTGALIASLVFVLGSFMVTQLHHTNVVSSAIWLPAILFFVEMSLKAKGIRRALYLLLGGVSLGLQNLGIHIQPVLLTLAVFSLYVPYRILTIETMAPRAKLKSLASTLLIVPAVGLGLAAIQLLPLYELGTFSFRGEGVSYSFATAYSLPLQNIVTLIWPYFFDRPDGSTWSLWVEWETTIYVGIVPFLLAVIAAIWARNRVTLFFGLIAILSLLLAFGDYSPLKAYSLVWQIPGFSSLRAPARFSYLFVFAMAVLAAYGWDWLVAAMKEGRAERGWKSGNLSHGVFRLTGASIILSAILLGTVLLLRNAVLGDKNLVVKFIQENYLVLRHQNPGLSGENIYNALLATSELTNAKTLQPIIILAFLAIILVVWWRFSSQAPLWRTLLVVLIAADLLLFATRFHPTVTWDGLAAPSGPARFLMESNGLHRVYNRHNGMRSEPNRLLPFKVAAVGGYSSLEAERTKGLLRAIDKGNSKLLDLWNVRFIIGKAGQSPLKPSSRVVYQEGDVVIYENDALLPRAFIANSFVVADSPAAALASLEGDDFTPQSAVILEEQPVATAKGPAPSGYSVANASLGAPAASSARITEYRRETVRLRADVARESFLVLSDSFYPGWTAYVDGRETKIYRANYLFRAIQVPPGSHSVEFVYRPLAFEIGKAISTATAALVLLACIALVARTRKRYPV